MYYLITAKGFANNLCTQIHRQVCAETKRVGCRIVFGRIYFWLVTDLLTILVLEYIDRFVQIQKMLSVALILTNLYLILSSWTDGFVIVLYFTDRTIWPTSQHTTKLVSEVTSFLSNSKPLDFYLDYTNRYRSLAVIERKSCHRQILNAVIDSNIAVRILWSYKALLDIRVLFLYCSRIHCIVLNSWKYNTMN